MRPARNVEALVAFEGPIGRPVDYALKKSTIALIMRANLGLGEVLFGKARGAVLGFLYGHPDESFYYRQLTRQLSGLSTGTLQRELDTLSALGLISRSSIGKQVFYQANREHPAFAELRALLEKTVGRVEILRTALEPIAHNISLAFIYGSVAKREESALSDVDVMVIGDVTMDEVLESLEPAERAIARSINPTIYAPPEFRSRLSGKNHFLDSVVRGPKIFLIGGEDELRRIARGETPAQRTNQQR